MDLGPLAAGRRSLLLATPLDRRRDTHALAIFRNRPARDVDAGLAQLVHDRIVGENVVGRLRFDQMLDPMAHGLGRMRFATVGRSDRGGEEIFQRDTVDSCIEIASAIVFRLSGRRCWTPCAKKASCCFTISAETFRIVRAR
jgi:hypothetical protein